jgi:hypothetical protein
VKITCMFVAGNPAVVGAVDADGFERFVTVQDNGTAGDLATVASGGIVTPDRPRSEAMFAVSDALLPITGDFTVEDACARARACSSLLTCSFLHRGASSVRAAERSSRQ